MTKSLKVNLAVVVIALVGIAGVGAAPAARGSTPAIIQPGAPVRPGHTPLGPFGACTLNFVFKDAAHTYIGTSARCTYEVGERAANKSGEFGTVVYRVLADADAPDKGPGPQSRAFDDFALIKIDERKLGNVNPVVRGFGAAPSGFTRSKETYEGTPLLMTGQGVGLDAHAYSSTRRAILAADDPQGFVVETASTVGDSGAPLIQEADGKALGVFGGPGRGGYQGSTVERILKLLHAAKFNVHLVTE